MCASLSKCQSRIAYSCPLVGGGSRVRVGIMEQWHEFMDTCRQSLSLSLSLCVCVSVTSPNPPQSVTGWQCHYSIPLGCPVDSSQNSRESTNFAHRWVRSRLKCSYWHFASWNMRYNEGSTETAQGPECHQLAKDCRIDLRTREIQLHETKWFGSAVYKVGNMLL